MAEITEQRSFDSIGSEDERICMSVQTIRELCRVEPFNPFDIYLVDGQVVRVEAKDRLLFLPKVPQFIVRQADDRPKIVYPERILKVELASSGSPAKAEQG